MNLKYNIFVLVLLIASCQSEDYSRIKVNIPSAETEAIYIWRTIQDIPFFEEHNYQVSLPKGALIEALKVKSKSNQLSDADYNQLEEFIRDSIYNEADYQNGYEKINAELALLNKMINEIDTSRFQWSFKEFDTYTVNLTLYGLGGSYDPDEGSILIYTTSDGKFKKYDNPANTIIHEIIHIGIEASIVSKYNVPHAMKERIVDTFVSLNFQQYLPDYKIQDMGDTRIDSYLTEITDLKTLDKIVKSILTEN